MDSRVENDVRTAPTDVFTMEQSGKLQMEFLQKMGLTEKSTILDLGCGPLHLGRCLVPFLDKDCYTGIDISAKALEAGRHALGDLMKKKTPRLIQTKDLKLIELAGKRFDYIHAFSVVNHLQMNQAKELFSNVPSIMHKKSRFFFTVRIHNKYEPTGNKPYTSFAYSMSDLKSLTSNAGLVLKSDTDGGYWKTTINRYDLLVMEVTK